MTTTFEDRTFDWTSQHDVRSLQFNIEEYAEAPPVLRNVTWRWPWPLNQLAEGACVGFALTHEALGTPVRVDFNRVARTAGTPLTDPTAFAREVYRIARDIDEFPGNEDNGTSINAGLKVMREMGIVKSWHWNLRGVEGLRLGLQTHGPGVLGLPWLSGMYRAPGGILTPSGSVVGGHAIYCPAYRLPGVIFEDDEAFGLLNSWGPDWGHAGFAWIPGKALAGLLAQWGEAAIITKRSYGR